VLQQQLLHVLHQWHVLALAVACHYANCSKLK
jgi:hypothetical protein